MRFSGYRKMVAITAAVSMLVGTGAFSVFAENENALMQSESEDLHAPHSDAGQSETEKSEETEVEKLAISWWICPTGGFSDEEKVQQIVDAYEAANPAVQVNIRILDAGGEDGKNGADVIDAALHDNSGPDVILAAPENIVTRWGAEGLMADLSQLWDEKTQNEFRSEMRDVARNRDEVWYAVPLYRDLYTMAINYDMFEKAGALQYLNEEAHSWKDSGFIDSVLRVHDVLVQESEEASSEEDKTKKTEHSKKDSDTEEDGIVGKIYCKDEVGQRAFRCFVGNFFKTGLVDEYRSSYQIGKGKIRSVFGTLRNLIGKGIEFDSGMNGEDENEAFLRGDLFLTFNWSAAKQQAAQDAGFRVFPMMYPNAKNVPTLTGPVRALGVVETQEEEKKEAALSFVRFLMTDEDAYRQAVLTAGCFPARRLINGHDLKDLYGADETMQLYGVLNDYYEDYEPTMELYPRLEEAWPSMLQQIGEGEKIKNVTTQLADELNEVLAEEYGIREIEVEEEE